MNRGEAMQLVISLLVKHDYIVYLEANQQQGSDELKHQLSLYRHIFDDIVDKLSEE